MVIVTVRFFTDGLKDKTVWDSGAVYLPKQPKHGIDIVRYNPIKAERKIL